jgi:hypothetical protein
MAVFLSFKVPKDINYQYGKTVNLVVCGKRITGREWILYQPGDWRAGSNIDGDSEGPNKSHS